MTRENAQELCLEHMSESVLSNSGNLINIRIGIPQVRSLSLYPVHVIYHHTPFLDGWQEYFPASLESSVVSRFRRVIRALKNRGATVLPVSLPNTSYALSAYYVISSAEASSNLARYDGVQYGLHVPLSPGSIARTPGEVYALSRTAGFGAEVKRRILLGTYALTAE
jgi:aspartyl-tRNA(Asn)/glutamyl-tRNA(Gln) amidotransferase subunit A